jgi:hypothetical protein
MSHRITTKTEMKDRGLAEQALTLAGMAFRTQGSNISITGGSLRGANLDLRTGVLSGDTDYHQGHMEDLRRSYAEAKFLQEIALEGQTVEQREVLQNGDVKLLVRAFG